MQPPAHRPLSLVFHAGWSPAAPRGAASSWTGRRRPPARSCSVRTSRYPPPSATAPARCGSSRCRPGSPGRTSRRAPGLWEETRRHRSRFRFTPASWSPGLPARGAPRHCGLWPRRWPPTPSSLTTWTWRTSPPPLRWRPRWRAPRWSWPPPRRRRSPRPSAARSPPCVSVRHSSCCGPVCALPIRLPASPCGRSPTPER